MTDDTVISVRSLGVLLHWLETGGLVFLRADGDLVHVDAAGRLVAVLVDR